MSEKYYYRVTNPEFLMEADRLWRLRKEKYEQCLEILKLIMPEDGEAQFTHWFTFDLSLYGIKIRRSSKIQTDWVVPKKLITRPKKKSPDYKIYAEAEKAVRGIDEKPLWDMVGLKYDLFNCWGVSYRTNEYFVIVSPKPLELGENGREISNIDLRELEGDK